MSITSTELQQIASRLRSLCTETRKAAEAKDLTSDDWRVVDANVEAFAAVADNVDGIASLLCDLDAFWDEIPDL